MTTPNRGRGRGYGRGRGFGRGNISAPEITVPLIGDWTAYQTNRNRPLQLPAPPSKKENIASSSSSKETSYKDVAVNDSPQEKEYFENPITEHILYIEDEDVQMTPNDGWSLKTRYLENRGYAGGYGQGRVNVEILLTITESVTITHHYQNNNSQNFISFSKCHINKILSPREWGLNPNVEKAILVEGKYIFFNYWDYIQAFSKAFYYQNPKNKHSWFFSMNPEILSRPVPNWFYKWWAKFGPSLEILPTEIMDLYYPWCDNSPLVLKVRSENLIFGQCHFLFFTKFQIPWIWRWTITIGTDELHIPCLIRNFFYKWWNKMSPEDIKKITDNIKTVIKDDKNQESENPGFQNMPIDKLKNYFQKKYPNEDEDQIMVRVLDHMKKQFFNTFPSHNNPEEDESMKTVSSPGSMDSNAFNNLAGESQEPAEPTSEDIWDALIGTLAQRNKGKNPAT